MKEKQGVGMFKKNGHIILMGQGNSELMDPRSLLTKNWVPLQGEPGVFVHRVTQEQLQRHHLRILLKDLPRETALFSARMTSHHPHVCRLLYFHPAPTDSTQHQNLKDFREMHIYTDRTLPMRYWRRQRVLVALQGLRRLIGIHGPIKITERMICENEVGQVKVWISENPVNNHPDSKYMSEEQAMADFAALLTRKNQELASLLIGCVTLKDAHERLLTHRQDYSPQNQHYSHRASGSSDLRRRTENNTTPPYKNVFGETDPISDKVNTPTTSVHNTKTHQKYPQSSFIPRDERKPSSQVGLNKYRDFLMPGKSNIDGKISNKSNPNESSLQYSKREEFQQQKQSLKPNRLNQINMEANQKGAQFLSFSNPNLRRPAEPSKPFLFQNRFQTVTNLPASNQFGSPKQRHEPTWTTSQIPNVFTSQNECPKDNVKWGPFKQGGFRQQRQQGNFKQQRSKGGYDITIINNNVNNFISNITHNHILQKQQGESTHTHQFRTYAKPVDPTSTVHSSNQFLKNTQKSRERYFNIPNFLQKKKTSNQWAEESAELAEKMKGNLSRKNTVSSNPSLESPYHFSSQNNLETFDCDHNAESAPPKKPFNLSRKNESSMSSAKIPPFNFSSLYPQPTTALLSAQASPPLKNQANFQFKIPLRTKTMDFYQVSKGSPKIQQLQSKSFTPTDFQSNTKEPLPILEKKAVSVPVPLEKKTEEADITIKSSQLDQEQKKPSEKKLQFKKQLRNQFKNLLGGQSKQKVEDQILTPLPLKKDEIKEGKEGEQKEGKEGNLKDKIKRKQNAFAELKKQALKVLTDD